MNSQTITPCYFWNYFTQSCDNDPNCPLPHASCQEMLEYWTWQWHQRPPMMNPQQFFPCDQEPYCQRTGGCQDDALEQENQDLKRQRAEDQKLIARLIKDKEYLMDTLSTQPNSRQPSQPDPYQKLPIWTEKDLKCESCHEIMHQPIKMPCCSRTFCKPCLKKRQKRCQLSCPKCESITDLRETLDFYGKHLCQETLDQVKKRTKKLKLYIVVEMDPMDWKCAISGKVIVEGDEIYHTSRHSDWRCLKRYYDRRMDHKKPKRKPKKKPSQTSKHYDHKLQKFVENKPAKKESKPDFFDQPCKNGFECWYGTACKFNHTKAELRHFKKLGQGSSGKPERCRGCNKRR